MGVGWTCARVVGLCGERAEVASASDLLGVAVGIVVLAMTDAGSVVVGTW